MLLYVFDILTDYPTEIMCHMNIQSWLVAIQQHKPDRNGPSAFHQKRHHAQAQLKQAQVAACRAMAAPTTNTAAGEPAAPPQHTPAAAIRRYALETDDDRQFISAIRAKAAAYATLEASGWGADSTYV